MAHLRLAEQPARAATADRHAAELGSGALSARIIRIDLHVSLELVIIVS
jgi:hypothetical protein